MLYNIGMIGKIIEYYGKEKQTIVAIEELSELEKELCKALRGKLNFDNLCEEVADVVLMLEQIKIMYGIKDDKIKEIIDYKTNRTLERMKVIDIGDFAKPHEIDISKLPCNTCEWRYSIHCPKCEWNKKRKVKVY